MSGDQYLSYSLHLFGAISERFVQGVIRLKNALGKMKTRFRRKRFMKSGREAYDELIKAKDLKVGDRLHLTFMGGDEYVSIERLHQDNVNKLITWYAHFYADLSDTKSFDDEVWIKKQEPS
jgi:hypothetical protein